jgi:hypothetical protein
MKHLNHMSSGIIYLCHLDFITPCETIPTQNALSFKIQTVVSQKPVIIKEKQITLPVSHSLQQKIKLKYNPSLSLPLSFFIFSLIISFIFPHFSFFFIFLHTEEMLLRTFFFLFTLSSTTTTVTSHYSSSSSQPPPSQQSSPSFTEWRSARATYYAPVDPRDTVGGACGYGDLSKAGYGMATVGLSEALFERGQICGACFELRCVDDLKWCIPGTSIIVTATNFCAPNYGFTVEGGGHCNPPNKHFVLPIDAFVSSFACCELQ